MRHENARPCSLPTLILTAVARPTGEMLSRETGHLPQQVQFTQIEAGPVYYFVATYEAPA